MLPIGLGASFGQCADEQLWVPIVAKNGLEMIAPAHDVVNSSGILDTQLSRHERGLAKSGLNVK